MRRFYAPPAGCFEPVRRSNEERRRKKWMRMRARLIGSGDGPEVVLCGERARREGSVTGVVVLPCRRAALV
jgi:hypothetical protein